MITTSPTIVASAAIGGSDAPAVHCASPARTGRSASRMSAPSRKRPAGSFNIARSTTCRSTSGTPGAAVASDSGSFCITWKSTACSESASKGLRFVSSS